MGKRRMYSKDIVRSDAFLDLPVSSRELYFQLGMDTDDRGYIPNAKSIIRLIGANQGDLEPLIAKGFLLLRGDTLLLQKHFTINNSVRGDRFHETTYIDDLRKLFIEDNGSYTDNSEKGKKIIIDVVGIPNGYQMDTEDKLSKDKIIKDNLNKDIDIIDTENKNAHARENIFVQEIINFGYVENNDIDLFKYEELFESFKNDLTEEEIMFYVDKVISISKTQQIKNRLAYLTAALNQFRNCKKKSESSESADSEFWMNIQKSILG